MPRKDRIYAVLWTWRQHKVVQTKKAGRDELRAWKARYEQMGWKVRSSGPDAYIATGPNDEQHAVAFHEYDAQTHERIWSPPKPKEPVEKPAQPRPRRGRRPVGV